MESLQVRTGEVRLEILDDFGESRGIFSFNPTDVKSAERVVALENEFQVKQAEFEERTKQCETPSEKVQLLIDVVDYFEGLIDECFGIGSSALIFGEAKTLSMFDDFFTGIIPYYQKASEDRKKKYRKSGK